MDQRDGAIATRRSDGEECAVSRSVGFSHRFRRWHVGKKLGIAATIGAGAAMWAVAFALMAGFEITVFPLD